jgi:energy-coupling factor transport system ATP-binding protein
LIEFRGVSFRYPGEQKEVLTGLDLKIQAGTHVGIMGPSGSGKSTLGLLMNGIHVPTSGDVVVDGMNTRDPGAVPEIRRRVGVVFQDPHLQFTSMSVEEELAFGLENLGVPSDEMERRVEDALSGFNLQKVRNQPPVSLSGGEKQRTSLAAVMILQPSYLVLDEATTLLSPSGRLSIMQAARSCAELSRSSLVVISQDVSELLNLERILVLQGGRLVFEDHPGSITGRWKELEFFGISIPLKIRFGLDENSAQRG